MGGDSVAHQLSQSLPQGFQSQPLVGRDKYRLGIFLSGKAQGFAVYLIHLVKH